MNLKMHRSLRLAHRRRPLLALTGLSLLAGLSAAVCHPLGARAASVRPFDAGLESFGQGSWSALLAQLPRPAIVLFSSLHCPTCPEAARRAFETRNRLHADAPLVVVMTDGDDDPVRASASYRPVASRLLSFEGLPALLRREVSPRWRGETPWFVLLHRDGSMQMQAGVPSASLWEAWARVR